MRLAPVRGLESLTQMSTSLVSVTVSCRMLPIASGHENPRAARRRRRRCRDGGRSRVGGSRRGRSRGAGRRPSPVQCPLLSAEPQSLTRHRGTPRSVAAKCREPPSSRSTHARRAFSTPSGGRRLFGLECTFRPLAETVPRRGLLGACVHVGRGAGHGGSPTAVSVTGGLSRQPTGLSVAVAIFGAGHGARVVAVAVGRAQLAVAVGGGEHRAGDRRESSDRCTPV